MFYLCDNTEFSLNIQVLYRPPNSFITLDHGPRKPIWCHTHADSPNVQLVSGSSVAGFLPECPDSVTYVKTEGSSATYSLKKLQRQNLTLRAVLIRVTALESEGRRHAMGDTQSRWGKLAPSSWPLWFRLEKTASQSRVGVSRRSAEGRRANTGNSACHTVSAEATELRHCYGRQCVALLVKRTRFADPCSSTTQLKSYYNFHRNPLPTQEYFFHRKGDFILWMWWSDFIPGTNSNLI